VPANPLNACGGPSSKPQRRSSGAILSTRLPFAISERRPLHRDDFLDGSAANEYLERAGDPSSSHLGYSRSRGNLGSGGGELLCFSADERFRDAFAIRRERGVSSVPERR